MKPQKQKYRHKPEEGVYGDCHRTAIAMLLNRDRDEVPNFGEQSPDDGAQFNKLVEEWLNRNGFTQVHIAFNCTLEELQTYMQAQNPGRYYLLGGHSCTGVNHTVVGLGDKIAADPSLTDAGIVGPMEPDGFYFVTFILPVFMLATRGG